jgi:hypothetical protein
MEVSNDLIDSGVQSCCGQRLLCESSHALERGKVSQQARNSAVQLVASKVEG